MSNLYDNDKQNALRTNIIYHILSENNNNNIIIYSNKPNGKTYVIRKLMDDEYLDNWRIYEDGFPLNNNVNHTNCIFICNRIPENVMKNSIVLSL